MDLQQLVFIILGSSVVATLISKMWDHFSRKAEREDDQNEYFYNPIKLQLIMLGSLSLNRKELMDESLKRRSGNEIISEDYKKEVNSLIEKWWAHAGIIKTIIETQPGSIRKEHFKLVADFMDGWIKRDIIGTSINKGTVLTNKERMSKIFVAIEALKRELLK